MRSKNDWLDYLEHSALCHYGVIGMHWGIRRYQPYSTVPRKSGEGGKEIGKAASNDKSSSSQASALSIKYKRDSDGDEVGNISFGNCKNCLVVIKSGDDFWDEPGGNKRDIDKIVSDSKFEKQMRSNAADGLYKYRTDNISNESKEQYKKKLRCEQMTATEPDRVHVWYTHPDDFGDWYMVVDTKNKKILSGEGYS